MPAPAAILDLVARFGEHIDAYKSGSYNEKQLRSETSTPFRGGYIALNRQYIENIPLPDSPSSAAQSRVTDLVEKRLHQHGQR